MKTLLPPPEEHAHNIKMEKCLKRLINAIKEGEIRAVNHHVLLEPEQLPQIPSQ